MSDATSPSDASASSNTPPPVVIHGAGGHGRAVAEAVGMSGREVLGFVDDGIKGLLDVTQVPAEAQWICGVGHNATRAKLLDQLVQEQRVLTRVIHPTAWLAPSVVIGEGVYVGPRAILHTDASIERGVIVNSGAIVEHDTVLEACCHVAPGVVMGGGVRIGQRTLIGLGARVLPGVTVGADCIIAAGSVLLEDVPDSTTVAGIPARRLG